MSNTDFQNWMKDKVAQQQFEPPIDGWQKLKADLQQETNVTPKVTLWKRSRAIAAALTLMLGLSVAYYFINHNAKGPDNVPSVVQQQSDAPKVNTLVQDVPASTGTSKVLSPFDEANSEPHFNRHRYIKAITKTSDLVKTNQENQNGIFNNKATIDSMPIDKKETDAIAKKGNTEKITHHNFVDFEPINDKVPIAKQPIELGIAANGGNNNVGTVQYQVALNARKQLTKKFFVDAAFAVTSNAVAFNNQYTFDGVTVNPHEGLGANIGGYESSESKTPITTKYKQNVYAIGLMPKFGFHLTKQISVMAGGFVHRNINTEVALSNSDDISSVNVSVPDFQTVNDWSAGITGGIEYKVLERVAAYAGYRQGITNYAYFLNRYHKNSGVEFGLKLKMGK